MLSHYGDPSEKKRILVVLVGGTICSKFSGNVKTNSDETGLILEKSFQDSYSPFADAVEFRLTEHYGIFSENMTVSKWNRLLQAFRSIPEIVCTAQKYGNYPSLKERENPPPDANNLCDGIIIAHGTDSLAYSAALFSILLREMGVPVFLVSSNEALSADCANGTDNFIAAVECICMGIKPNVYVTYKNPSDNRMYLHYASRLKQCANYQADFSSVGMVDISDLSPENAFRLFGKLPRAHFDLICRDNEQNVLIIDLFRDWQLTASVLLLEPYVGLNYDFFDLERVDAVLHGTYHSGTVCSESAFRDDYSASVLHLLDRCQNTTVYIAPADLSGNIYETSANILKACRGNVYFVNGFTKEMLYAKLLVAYSYEPLQKHIHRFLSGEYNHEIVIELNGVPKLLYPHDDESAKPAFTD